MRSALVVVVLGLLAGVPAPGLASQEGVLVWSSFSVHSSGIGQSGPADASGTYGEGGVTELTIKAFGREFMLNQSQLRQLQGMHLNGMQLSYEEGYARLGGRTVYLVLSMGFTSGTRTAKRVTLNERGDITVTPNGGP